MRLLNQIAAVTAINLKSLPQRFWLSLSTVAAVALVVTVLLSFLAMAGGFQKTIRGAGAEDVAILLRASSQAELNSGIAKDQLRLIEEGPGVARDAKGEPMVSGELYLVVDGTKRSTGTKANLPLRGIGPQGAAIRRGVTLVEGRMMEPGSNELVVGRNLTREFAGFDLGARVRLRNTEWTVVGVFESGGSVFESEVWGDIGSVQSFFNRQNFFQSIRVRLDGPEGLQKLSAYSEADPRLKLDVKTEQAYFAEQSSQTSDLIQTLGWPLAIAMAFGALAGALNTMYSSVSARTREIATLRAIGFSGFPAFVATLLESLILAAIGGVLGGLVTWVFFDGLTTSTLGASFTQVVFSFTLTPEVAFKGVLLALGVGFLGGLFPAIRAARMPVVAAFGEH